MKRFTAGYARLTKLVLIAGMFIEGIQSALADSPMPAVPAGTTPAAPQPPGMVGMVVPFVLMFGVFYFLMIRPQQKKMKEQQAMLSALKAGDEVVTSSGLLGKVVEIADKVVTLELDRNVKVRMLRSQIAQTFQGSVNQIKELETAR